jgi:membrane protein YdbS with pleckstrin-like domain
MDGDRLRVVRGLMWRKDTVVPFGRVQHIDIERGPIARYYGLSTLVLHTAGTHNASVSLPGLGETNAMEMREVIREKIRRDTL